MAARSPRLAEKLWWAQMALNFLWTPVYFGAHQIGLAFIVILLMLAAILAFVATAWRHGCSCSMPPGWPSRRC
jgi:tryptophan-rich sensory protein